MAFLAGGNGEGHLVDHDLTRGEHLLDLRGEPRGQVGRIAEIFDVAPADLVGRDAQELAERAVGEDEAAFAIEGVGKIRDRGERRLEDARLLFELLGDFQPAPLGQAGLGDIDKTQHHARDAVVARAVGEQLRQEPALAVASPRASPGSAFPARARRRP